MTYTAKNYIGSIIYDLPKYILSLIGCYIGSKKYNWYSVHNRDERIIREISGNGIKCDREYTSKLYLPKLFPLYGRQLLRCATKEYPVSLKENKDVRINAGPDISFIIGHRGKGRLPLLLATLRSISNQVDSNIECIVVEQDDIDNISKYLPDWVRYINMPLAYKDMPYSRSRAFNFGVNYARSPILVLHDNDILVPKTYAYSAKKYINNGYKFVNLKRFIFYMTKESTRRICSEYSIAGNIAIDYIMQNAEGGGSICADREAYAGIGGFDDNFVGWGGEDNEFWERALTMPTWEYGLLPMVHLWHESQKRKYDNTSDTYKYYKKLSRIHPNARIKKLTGG